MHVFLLFYGMKWEEHIKHVNHIWRCDGGLKERHPGD